MKKAYEFKAGEEYVLYADGSSLNNGAPDARGGWAFVILDKDERFVLFENSGCEYGATNNQMELRAAIEGIEALPAGCYIHMKLDSQYVIKGSTEWMPGWIAKGFKKNEGLWRRIIQASEKKFFRWTWVKGHSDNPWNGRCDDMAVAAAHTIKR